jgi:hypothetical protein
MSNTTMSSNYVGHTGQFTNAVEHPQHPRFEIEIVIPQSFNKVCSETSTLTTFVPGSHAMSSLSGHVYWAFPDPVDFKSPLEWEQETIFPQQLRGVVTFNGP